MKRLLVSCLLCAVLGLFVAPVNGALSPPSPVQHELSIVYNETTGDYDTLINTDPNYNKYDPTEMKAYLINNPPPNEVKHAWLFATFRGGGWLGQGAQLGTDPGFRVQPTGQEVMVGPDKLVIWQTWDVWPNPPREWFDLSGFFRDPAGGINNMKLISLDIQTTCVPEPTTIIAGGLALLALGVTALRRNRS